MVNELNNFENNSLKADYSGFAEFEKCVDIKKLLDDCSTNTTKDIWEVDQPDDDRDRLSQMIDSNDNLDEDDKNSDSIKELLEDCSTNTTKDIWEVEQPDDDRDRFSKMIDNNGNFEEDGLEPDEMRGRFSELMEVRKLPSPFRPERYPQFSAERSKLFL